MIFLGIAILAQTAYGLEGELGYFGGISEGTRLPKTVEMVQAKTNTKKSAQTELVYKEVLFLSGQPVVFEGILRIRQSGEVSPTADTGSYTETYTIVPSVAGAPVSINRTIRFRTNYRKVNNQIIKDSVAEAWTETIAINGTNYTLNFRESKFEKSVLEDQTPGVTYYSGNISQRAVYTSGTGQDAQKITADTSGSIYGYDQPWARTETHRLDVSVNAGGWQLHAQVRPSVTVNKVLEYASNEPQAISFAGNYREIMQNHGGLQYDIFVGPPTLTAQQKKGSVSIPSFNSVEQLIAPNVNFLRGHFAEEDIKKLYSMEILEGDPKQFQPNTAMTRAQYVRALCRALDIKPEAVPTTTTSRTRNQASQPIEIVFSDVMPSHPDYGYIMGAYKSGLISGSGGKFNPGGMITRQEAFVMYIRVLGLQRLGLDPTPYTPFVDDRQIGSWAKQEIYAAYNLGLIKGDTNGKLRPLDRISKAEGAALINRLIDYMRTGMEKDYKEKIVNYAN